MVDVRNIHRKLNLVQWDKSDDQKTASVLLEKQFEMISVLSYTKRNEH